MAVLDLLDRTQPATNEWQARLRSSTIAPDAQDAIILYENGVVESFEKQGDEFVASLMDVYNNRGLVTLEDVERSIRDSMDYLEPDIIDTTHVVMVDLHNAAVENAHSRLSPQGKLVTTASIILTADDRINDEQRIKDAISRALTKVKTLPDDVLEDIREKLMTEHVKPAQDIVRDMLLEKEFRELEVVPPQAVEQVLRDIWTRQRYIYERIVRTETVNAYARRQLEEWRDQGITEVTRHSINDSKTCAICRELSRPGYNVYKIDDLLALEYPLTQDPATGGWLTHPHCRCSFHPKVNWDFLDDIEGDLNDITIPPSFDVTREFSTQFSDLTNVPVEHEDSIKKLLERDDPAGKFEFVPDVTEDDRWREQRFTELNKQHGLAEGKDKYDDEIIGLRGKLKSYTLDDGTTLVSGFAGDTAPVASVVLRPKAEVVWDSMSQEQRNDIVRTFNGKKKTTEFTLQDEGIQVFGGEPFITPQAAKSPKEYFVESYLSYVNEPIRVRFMDTSMYSFLKDSIFEGRQFVEEGDTL